MSKAFDKALATVAGMPAPKNPQWKERYDDDARHAEKMRLAALAPELVEALEDLMDMTVVTLYERINAGDEPLIRAARKAAAALAKAKGQTP